MISISGSLSFAAGSFAGGNRKAGCVDAGKQRCLLNRFDAQELRGNEAIHGFLEHNRAPCRQRKALLPSHLPDELPELHCSQHDG